MIKHKKIYLEALGLSPAEPVLSELSGKVANDIHHIERRGMGGTTNPEANSIFNLMALTRDEHIEYVDKVKYKDFLKQKHMEFLMKRGVRMLGIFHQVNFMEDKIEFML